MPSRVLIILAALTTLAGCSVETFTYTINRYGEVKGTHVHLGCRDTYEVFDRREAGTLLVVTNGLNETLVTTCESSANLPRRERMRRVADIFLAETSTRPDCRVARETELTDYHAEFNYRCPPKRASGVVARPRQ